MKYHHIKSNESGAKRLEEFRLAHESLPVQKLMIAEMRSARGAKGMEKRLQSVCFNHLCTCAFKQKGK